jgi:hypothetical protein
VVITTRETPLRSSAEMTENKADPREPRAPRRHRSPARRRPLSLWVAAPAFITVAVVAVALVSATGGGKARPSPSTSASRTPPPPASGWYALHPIAYAQAELDGCLSILPDDADKPSVGQDRCSAADPLQRIRLDPVAAGGAFTLKAFNFTDKIWCASLVSLENNSRIEMRPCKTGAVDQQFTLAATGSSSRQGPVFRLQPASTRSNGMCVGVRADHPATAHAVHTNCGRAGVLGFVLSPVGAPTGSSS